MKNLSSLGGSCLSAALLAACGGGSQIAPLDSSQQNAPQLSNLPVHHASTPLVQGRRVTSRPDHRKSWMNQMASRDKLLYVSDIGTNDVNVYSYPDGSLVGQLTGFNEPQGECVDSMGNILITNTLDSDILEYAHGGTAPIATWHDPGQYPVDCSYSKYLNSIAVANSMTTSGGPGSVAVYGNPNNPNIYSNPQLYRVNFLSYDRKNHLFVDGTTAKGNFHYAKMGVLGHFYELNLKVIIGFPAGVQFSGKHTDMAVGDSTGTIYLAHGPNILGTTTLGDSCSLGQFFITKSKVIVPEACNASVSIYPYPVGGSPLKIITDGLSEPVGAALSLQKGS